jgi:anti-sigma B factor antagonist
MAGVELSSRVCDGHVVVALCGELDYAYAADAEAAIIEVTAPGQSLIVDMSALDFIDCSSLSILLRVQRLARQAGGDMVLAAPQRQTLRLLALTDKDHTFCVHPSVQAAVASLGSAPVRGALSAGLR